MTPELFLASIISVATLVFAVKRWALTGDLLHPGLIYAALVCSQLLIYAVGPYTYGFDAHASYFVTYAVISLCFILGAAWGDRRGKRGELKPLHVSRTVFWSLFFGTVLLTIINLIPVFLTYGFSLEAFAQTGQDRSAAILEERVDTGGVLISQAITSLTQVATCIVAARVFSSPNKPLRVFVIGTLALLAVANGLTGNSRTLLVSGLIPVLVPLYVIAHQMNGSRQRLISFLRRYRSKLAIGGLATLSVLIVITNARSALRFSGDLRADMEYVERFFYAEKRPWFESIAQVIPDSFVNTAAQLTIYAGSTVANGGLATKIALDNGLQTWGLRSLFPVQRILSQLRLDFGLSEYARQNLIQIVVIANETTSALQNGWLGDPANLILDFGLLLAPAVNLVFGWLVGWFYGRSSRGGLIIAALGMTVTTVTVIFVPALGPFASLAGFFNYVLLAVILVTHRKTRRVAKSSFARSDDLPLNSDLAKPTH